jgi:hypothetical protein
MWVRSQSVTLFSHLQTEGDTFEDASGVDGSSDESSRDESSDDIKDDLWGSSYQYAWLDRIDRATGSMQEIVMSESARYLVVAVSPDLLGESLEGGVGVGMGRRGGDESECTPRITALPAHSIMYQTQDGINPDYGREIDRPGTAICHKTVRFIFRPPAHKGGVEGDGGGAGGGSNCGPMGCVDQFAVLFPCGDAGEGEENPTLTIRVVQPPHQNVTAAELFPLTASPSRIVAGNSDIALSFLHVANAAQFLALGYTQVRRIIIIMIMMLQFVYSNCCIIQKTV